MTDQHLKNNRSAGKEIGIISRCAHRYFQQKLRHYSIGHSQIRTLHYIIRHNGCSQSELVKHLQVDKSSVTSQIERLESNGYISRVSNTSDSRSKQLYITKKTESFQDELISIFSGWSKKLLSGFTEQEKDHVYEFLDRIKENALQEIEDLNEKHG
jgi:DNA-binding MarR family transcriptional regulator